MTWKIELKVITTAVVGYLVGIGVAIGNAVEAHHELLGSVGPTWQALIIALVPGTVTALVGYQTKHTARPDINPADTATAPRTVSK